MEQATCSSRVSVIPQLRATNGGIVSIDSLYDQILNQWNVFDFLERGAYPSGLPPSFSTEGLASNFFYLYAASKEIRDKHFTPAVFSFPRPGISSNRRVASLLHPISLINIAYTIRKNWKMYKKILEKRYECVYETSIPVQDMDRLRYLVPALSHRSLEQVRTQTMIAFTHVVKFDIQSYYPTLYTHAIEWAMVGKEQAKDRCRSCSDLDRQLYSAAQELDKIIRNSQSRESYGIPIGPDSSLLISELIGKGILKTLLHLLKLNNINDYLIIRHVDDYLLFINESSNKIFPIIREAFQQWNFLTNETKLQVYNANTYPRNLWTYQIGSFMPNSKEIEHKIESIRHYPEINRSKLETYNINNYELSQYLDLAHTLQQENPSSNVITYALRRLHFNSRVNPGAGFGSNYLMNPSLPFYKSLDAQLTLLLSMYPQNIDAIADVYIWYFWWKSYRPAHLRTTIEKLLNNIAGSSDNHFETVWALWLARYFEIELSNVSLDVLSRRIRSPVVALQFFDYMGYWSIKTGNSINSYINIFHERISNNHTDIAEASALEDAFYRSDWIFYYSMHLCPWSDIRNAFARPVRNSNSQPGKFINTMITYNINLFTWSRYNIKISKIDKILGLSRKGSGGVTARVYPT